MTDLDLTVEIITHRFTPGSKEVLLGWYPRTKLEMDEDQRSQKRSNSAAKYDLPAGNHGRDAHLVHRRARTASSRSAVALLDLRSALLTTLGLGCLRP
ncbi:MAG: spore photoproduct lyase family protein [Nocardioidaceae bacterium]